MSNLDRKRRILLQMVRNFACMLITVLLALIAIIPVQAQTGVYTLNGGTATQTGQTYAATLTDQSAVYVLNSGNLTLNSCTMTKTGDS
jgi:ferric-dicitrate binding protein FerR (iron transport regulator)